MVTWRHVTKTGNRAKTGSINLLIAVCARLHAIRDHTALPATRQRQHRWPYAWGNYGVPDKIKPRDVSGGSLESGCYKRWIYYAMSCCMTTHMTSRTYASTIRWTITVDHWRKLITDQMAVLRDVKLRRPLIKFNAAGAVWHASRDHLSTWPAARQNIHGADRRKTEFVGANDWWKR